VGIYALVPQRVGSRLRGNDREKDDFWDNLRTSAAHKEIATLRSR
jgi:hypothetical protein